MNTDKIKEGVKKTYTEVVTKNTNSCCGPSCCSPAQEISFLDESYKNVEGYQAVADYGLGCGLPTEIAGIKKGDTVLDLGSGAGNDVFIARSQTGETGKVIGVDFTEAMLSKANENKQKLGYQNVEFVQGDIEELPIESESIDVVISNCVMNLVPDKAKAYKEVFRVLKPGGHFSISDVVLNGSLPKAILNAAEMYAACVSGALEKNAYLQVIKDTGFEYVSVLKQHDIVLPDEVLLQFINKEEIEAYRKNTSAIVSITINGQKPKA
ncbi:MAG: arsenite methyltransferase [Bacteroidetes bacterium]|nr:arsenite methyltransferase [Bacteroidota bacterium]